MKKNLIRLFVSALGAACVLSLAACGGNEAPKDSSAPASSAAVSSAPASSAAESGASSAVDLASCETVEDFIKAGVLDEDMDALKESLASSGMDADITANGNQMVFTFTYQDTEGVDPDTLGSLLGTLTDSMAETFEEVASDLSETVEAEASVVVTFVAEDGTELYSQEFFPSSNS